MPYVPARSLVAALVAGALVVLVLLSAVAAAGEPGVAWSGYFQVRETVRPREGVRFSVPAARLVADARLDSIFTVRVSAEVAASTGGANTVQMRDAYIQATRRRWTARAGQFKTPQSRELLLSDERVETPERSLLVAGLTPGRDLGVQLAYAAASRRWDVTAGVWNGEGQNVFANRDSTVLFAGRVTARPLDAVGLGASAAAFGDDSTRVGGDVELRRGRAWLRAEGMTQSIEGRPRDDVGFYALAGCRVAAAWSVVARGERIDRPALGAATSRVRATTIGLLWERPESRVRLQVARVDRWTGQDDSPSHSWLAQLQGRF